MKKIIHLFQEKRPQSVISLLDQRLVELTANSGNKHLQNQASKFLNGKLLNRREIYIYFSHAYTEMATFFS